MKKLFSSLLALGLLFGGNAYAKNCNPNEYNDGQTVKEYEDEWKYDSEEAYSFGKKIQRILQGGDLRRFIDLTTGPLRVKLETRYKKDKSFENYFSGERLKKLVNEEVYCFPLGSIDSLQFWIGFSLLSYTQNQNKEWVVLDYE